MNRIASSASPNRSDLSTRSHLTLSDGILLGMAACAVVAAVLCGGCTTTLSDMMDRTKADRTAPSSSAASRPQVVAGDLRATDVLCVNNESVSAADLWKYNHADLAKARKAGEREYHAYVERVAAKLIPDRITEMLLYQHAAVRLPPEAEKNVERYVDGEIRKMITAQHGGVQRRFDRDLAEQGLTIDDMRDRVRREVIITSFLEREIRPKVAEPTRAELMSAFEANKEQWRQPSRRSMSLIDVRVASHLPDGTTDPTREQKEAARAEARSLIQSVEVQLRNGADFAEMARQHSEGLHASEGGTWGWVTADAVRDRFRPAVDALEKLDTGQTSPVIETADGFFLVKCDQHDAAVDPTFRDVQPQIKEAYLRAGYDRLIGDLVRELRAKARISPRNLELYHAAAVDAAIELLKDQP